MDGAVLNFLVVTEREDVDSGNGLAVTHKEYPSEQWIHYCHILLVHAEEGFL